MPVPKKIIARVQSPREKARQAMNSQKPIKSSGNRTRVFITHLPLGDRARPSYRPIPEAEHKEGHSSHGGGGSSPRANCRYLPYEPIRSRHPSGAEPRPNGAALRRAGVIGPAPRDHSLQRNRL